MAKRIHFFRTELQLSHDEQQELIKQIKTRFQEMGHDDDVMILVKMHYEGAIEDVL